MTEEQQDQVDVEEDVVEEGMEPVEVEAEVAAVELAAYSGVMNVILNLDETLTKE